jgi:hypothetical protein
MHARSESRVFDTSVVGCGSWSYLYLTRQGGAKGPTSLLGRFSHRFSQGHYAVTQSAACVNETVTRF